MSEFEYESSTEMDHRAALAQEFYSVAFSPEERPIFVSDRASIYDISPGDEAEIVSRCESYYGVTITENHLRMPLWEVLDFLSRNRSQEKVPARVLAPRDDSSRR